MWFIDIDPHGNLAGGWQMSNVAQAPAPTVSDLSLYHPNPDSLGLVLTEQWGFLLDQPFVRAMLTQRGTGSRKAPALLIAFTSSSCSSGAEGSMRDTRVNYSLCDFVLDEPETGYDFHGKQCQRGKGGVVEMHKEKQCCIKSSRPKKN